MPKTKTALDELNNQGHSSPGNTIWADVLQNELDIKKKNEAELQALKRKNQDALMALQLASDNKLEENRVARAKARIAMAHDIANDYQDQLEREAFEKEKKRAAELYEIKKRYQALRRKAETQAEKEALKAAEKREKDKAKRKSQSEDAGKQIETKGKAFANSVGDIFEKGGGSFKEKLGNAFTLGKDLVGDTLKQASLEMGDALMAAGKQAVGNLAKAGAQAVEESMRLLTGRQSKIMARLQSSGETFTEINARMQVALSASPFVKYSDMLAKVEELVDQGVAYNVEQRAFLASISDKIASTFDAFDSNLLKIIRIQQEDSTKQRLGMEAALTKFLNRNYQDTSYLSGAHDSVTEALTASIVQLGTNKGAEFEYAVQKWFGSLSSLGMDDSTLTGLAGAINALSTGDVESMAGSEFMNLIVMAANKSGISYADILTKGLNAESVNSLLSSIVSYWSEIASTSNQVVKNQYSKLFGLSMSDMTAIKNVTQKDMNNIYRENLSYSDMNLELIGQMAQIPLRMHASEMINNVLDNVMEGIGMNIAGNPFSAATWTINKFIKDATGGINIPAITAMVMGTGTGFDINSDVNSLIQLGMVGMSTLGQVGKVIAGLGGLGGLNLAYWGADQYTRHGQGLSAPVTGVSASTSSTVFIGNSNSQDVYSSTLNKAYDDAGYNEVKNSVENDPEVEKQKKQMEEIDSNVAAILTLLSEVSTGSALRVVVENYGLTGGFGT